MRFTSFVTEEMATKVDDFAQNSAIIVGLHCCGDFSSTILKVFLKSRKARALVLFGCCYHKEFQSFHFLNPDNKDAQTLNVREYIKRNTQWLFFPGYKTPNFHSFSVKSKMERMWFELQSSRNRLSQQWKHGQSVRQNCKLCNSKEKLSTIHCLQSADSSRYARAHLEKWIWEVSDSPSDRNIGMCSVRILLILQDIKTKYFRWSASRIRQPSRNIFEKL